jgi:hypothetical protein
MKKLIRFAAAGALIAGATVVHAQNQPSSDTADLWLFVSDQAAGTTFAEDTGIAITSLMPSYATASSVPSAYVPNAVNSTALGSFSGTYGPSSALTSYINAANTAGQTLEWAVEAINEPGSSTGTGYKKAGGITGLTTNNGLASLTTSMQLQNLQNWANGFQGDVAYLAGTYVAGGASYSFSSGGTAGNVWGASQGASGAGSTNLYGQGADSAGVGLGQSATLYGATANGTNASGSTGVLQTYNFGSIEVTANGTLEAVTAVPLPAAVWLFGSGLLGLAGIGRRRSAAGLAAA